MKRLLLTAGVFALAAGAVQAQYSNAVIALSPIGYWPLNETNAGPAAYVAANRGTLGSLADAFYNNPYPDSLGTPAYTLFNTPAPGITSDGDSAAAFNTNSVAPGDPTGYMIIPHRSPALTTSGKFSTEVWVKPLGGDPNDPTGASYASTEWASIVKEGYGGNGFGDNGTASGNGAGWSIALNGIYSTGYPVGWYTPGPVQLLTNASWIVDFFSGNNGGSPSLEFNVPMYEPTPQWFHLVLTYDGTNANFYTNGVLAATTVLGLPQSTNKVWAPGNSPITTPTGAYAFTPDNGVSFAPDTVSPIVLGTINTSGNLIGDGYPNTPDGTVGFNNQTYCGFMDELAIYTNALPAATVAKHYSDATAANTTLYTNDVLSLNPPVYLRFDEPAYVEPATNTFSTAFNYGSMGSAADGSYEPGVITVAGPDDAGFGSSDFGALFNGLDAGVLISGLSGTALDPGAGQSFSLAYWFKANPTDYARFQTILGRGDSGWRSGIDQQGSLRWNPGAGPELKSPVNYNDGAWHFVVGTTDGTSDYLYVDGQLSVSNSPVGSLGGSPYGLLIGGAPDYTITKANGNYERYFAGEVAQVAFFGTALTPTQVQTLYFSASLPASITTEPPATDVIAVGEDGELAAGVSGTPPLAFQWYQNGSKISNSVTFGGATSNVLTITSAASAQDGSYTLVVTNVYGAATSSPSVVTVSSAPFILQQPSPAVSTVYAGNAVLFSVGAVGAAPLQYQWFKGAEPINGATASNFTAIAVAGSNNYSVVVSNSIGSQPSASVAVVGVPFVPPAAGFVVNFNDSGNGAYEGLGVYNDLLADTNWNVFPNPPGGTTPDAKTSSDTTSLVTLSMDFGFNNGVNNAGYQGHSCFIVEYEAGVNGGNPGAGTAANPMGTFTFNDVPQGVYTLYVYSANYDGNRGSIINLAPVNGGIPDEGLDATTNFQSDHTCDTNVEGDNYVFFHDVVPDATGTISGTYIPNPNGQLTGEGQINGLQLVLDSAKIEQVSATTVTLTWTGASLQSSTNVAGPWTTLTNTSPITIPTSGGQQFFQVY